MGQGKRLTDEEINLITTLYKKGKTSKNIAKTTGISYRSVCRWIAKYKDSPDRYKDPPGDTSTYNGSSGGSGNPPPVSGGGGTGGYAQPPPTTVGGPSGPPGPRPDNTKDNNTTDGGDKDNEEDQEDVEDTPDTDSSNGSKKEKEGETSNEGESEGGSSGELSEKEVVELSDNDSKEDKPKKDKDEHLEDLIEYSEKETKYWKKNLEALEKKVNEEGFHCSSCNEQVNHQIRALVKGHPELGVLVCENCRKFYGKGRFCKDEDGYDEYCRWCAEGGNLLCCEQEGCFNAFCKICVKKNLGRSEAYNAENAENWSCYVCDKGPLREPRAILRTILYCIQKEERKADKISRTAHNNNNKVPPGPPCPPSGPPGPPPAGGPPQVSLESLVQQQQQLQEQMHQSEQNRAAEEQKDSSTYCITYSQAGFIWTLLEEHRDSTSQDSGISQLSAGGGDLKIIDSVDDESTIIEESNGILSGRSSSVSSPTHRGISAMSDSSRNGLDSLTDEDMGRGNGQESDGDVISSVIAELSNSDEGRGAEKRAALTTLIKLAQTGSTLVWNDNFKAVLALLIKTLDCDDGGLRALVLAVLTEMMRRHPLVHHFLKFSELIILRVLNSHADKEKEVLRAAQVCAGTVAEILPPEVVIQVLQFLIKIGEYPVNQAAIKMLYKLVEAHPPPVVSQALPEIMPGLVKAYDNKESCVRKESVFCMVALHNTVGEEMMKPHLEPLTGSKLKLLNLYIKRAETQNSGASSPKSEPPL